MMPEDDRHLLLRLNGTVEGLAARIEGMADGLTTRLASIDASMHMTADEIRRLRERMHDLAAPVQALVARTTTIEKTMVTRDAFEPVKRITYGLVALLTSGVVLALLGLVLRLGKP